MGRALLPRLPHVGRSRGVGDASSRAEREREQAMEGGRWPGGTGASKGARRALVPVLPPACLSRLRLPLPDRRTLPGRAPRVAKCQETAETPNRVN